MGKKTRSYLSIDYRCGAGRVFIRSDERHHPNRARDRLADGQCIWPAGQVDDLPRRVEAESPEESGGQVAGAHGIAVGISTHLSLEPNVIPPRTPPPARTTL